MNPCSCNENLELVPANEPWNDKYFICKKCDSTFTYEEKVNVGKFTWLKVSEYPPPRCSILIFCNFCQSCHTVDCDEYFDDIKWCLVEDCNSENGHHFLGGNVDFDYWMPLPETPFSISAILENSQSPDKP